MSPVLKDKVAIITGAELTVKEIRDKGGEAVAINTDISDEDATKKMAEKVMKLYGKVDILINDAAYTRGAGHTTWDAWTVKEWDRMFAVNVRGTWLCCKAIAPLMIKESKGKIINIASDIIKLPASQTGLTYACTKAAVYTLTQSLARALGPAGINVNAIAPGLTATEATIKHPRQAFEATIALQQIKRREEPADLVGTAVFLASKDSDFITGQVIIVDGGALMF
jgi:NAD(P)-dependent dehydrogenase (short-subunit alcohol dehydrogenase family)